MKEIKLTQGYITLVDDEDYEYLTQWNWCINKSTQNEKFIYAVSRIDKKLIRMHRLLMKVPNHLFVDHKDNNGLNNQKINLRICTKAENSQNKVKLKGKNKYKGVTWYPLYNKWVVKIKCNNINIHIGYFVEEKEAALAYNKAAVKHHKEFAKLNKIED